MDGLIEAQNLLKENEEEFRRILGDIPISMSIIQPDGEILLVNKKTIEIFDVEEENFSGFNVSGIWANPEQRDAWLDEIKTRGIVSDYEIDVITFTGARKILQMSGLMITFEGQRCILSVHQDITEKKKAEEALRKSEEQLRAIYDNSPISVELFGPDGSLIHANPAALDLFGVDDLEVVTHFSLFADPNISDEGKRLIAGGETYRSDQIFDFEKVREQNLYPTSRRGTVWLDVLITPLKTSSGSVSGFLVQIQDITDRKQMAEEVRRSEEKYRDLADNAPIGILACDRDGNVTYLNNRVLDMLFSPDEKTTGINLLQDKILMQTGFADIMKDVLVNGAEYPPFDLKYTSSRGKDVYLRMHVSPILAGDTPEGARIIVDNITRRREAELLLERTQFAFDHSPDEIYFVNRDGLIVYANAHTSESFGITPDAPMDATIFDINPDISPERWRGIWSVLEREGYFRLESVHRYPDGTPYPVDLIKYPIVFDGEVYSCTIARDITEIKQTEEALRKSEGRLRTLIQTIPDLVWLKDEKGVYLSCNSMFESFFGACESEIVGKTDYDFVDRELADFFRENDRRAALAGKPTVNEEWISFASDGRRALLETIKTPLYSSKGHVAGVLGIGRDVTERKKTEEALRGVNKKLNLLSSITRHDILNQITGAAGFLEMIELEDEIPHGSQTEAYLKMITGAVETIERQITFTGYYKDLGEQAPDWVDVGHVIEEVAQTPSFEAVRIENTIAGVEVFADLLFEKVIYNLIDNAVKHGETITEVSFYTEERPEDVVIVCEDDGVGIPADAKEKIFRREYFKNSGLGLFLSGEILSITGLTITETGTPGEGARFEIHVPKEMIRPVADESGGDGHNV